MKRIGKSKDTEIQSNLSGGSIFNLVSSAMYNFVEAYCSVVVFSLVIVGSLIIIL